MPRRTKNEMPEGFCDRLVSAARNSGMKDIEICKAIGVCQSYIAMIKQKDLVPAPEVIYALSRVLGVSMDWLFYGVDAERIDARQVLPCKCGGKQIRIAIHPGRVSADTTYSLYCPACDGESDKRHIPADAIISWNSKNATVKKTWLI